MISARRFRVNTPDVVHETIEGEAVIVNLSNGVYYSVDGAGADIWTLIEGGLSAPQIVTSLTLHYTGSQEAIAAGVDRFLAQLQAESLIVVDDNLAAAPFSPAVPSAPEESRPKFETPELQRYIDMEDLLLLDPVHDVDEQGWPPDAAVGA